MLNHCRGRAFTAGTVHDGVSGFFTLLVFLVFVPFCLYISQNKVRAY
jgi:hypothetical protein